VACLQLPIVDLLGTSTINVMMVAMAERDGDRRAMLALWHATIARLTMVFLPLVTLLFLVADDLITLIYTEAFSASVPIFRLSLVFILLFAIPVDGALRVFARTRFILGMNVFRLAFIAASIGWFIGAFGLIGAMVTPVLATALVKLGALWRIRRLLEVRAVDLIPWRSLAANVTAVAIAAVPAWLVKIELDLPQLASIAVVSAVFAVACLAILGATRALQTTIGPVIPHQERVG
jgi:O-antigen/teichoic acid export membrane protein